MRRVTQIAMNEIEDAINKTRDVKALFIKVNWIIVHRSHDITDGHRHKDHITRQKIRRRLWTLAQQRYPVLRKYIIPHEIRGDSKCVLKATTRTVHVNKPSFFSRIIGALKRLFR
jgi:hypothetical protein